MQSLIYVILNFFKMSVKNEVTQLSWDRWSTSKNEIKTIIQIDFLIQKNKAKLFQQLIAF